MGFISFMKNAGERIFGKSEEKKESEKSQAILEHIKKFNFDVEGLDTKYDDEVVTVYGTAKTVEDKNRVLVAAGNVKGVSKVNDQMTVEEEVVEEEQEPEKQFHTVVSGDTLSKISKKVYGDAMKYNIIFEANKPMLTNPDKIYPGQVLVIPKLK